MSHAALPPIRAQKSASGNQTKHSGLENGAKNLGAAMFESLPCPGAATTGGQDTKDVSSLPCAGGFETNFVESGPRKAGREDDLSNLPLQTLSFRNLTNVSYLQMDKKGNFFLNSDFSTKSFNN